MNLYDTIDLIRDTLEKHYRRCDNTMFGHPDHWDIKVCNLGNKAYGYCNLMNKEIVLSDVLMEHGSSEEIKDTALHEAAHALAGLERTRTGRIMGHGRLWKLWARRVGCDPSAKARNMSKSLKEAMGGHGTSKYYILKKEHNGYDIRGFCNRRLKNLKDRAYKNDPDTHGNLWMIRVADWKDAGGDLRVIESKKFR